MASMTFEFLDVGMGDSTLVIMKSGATTDLVLVDLGIQPFAKFKIGADDAAVYLVNTIAQYSKTTPYITELFITHPDQDHYNRIMDLITTNFPGFPGKALSIGRLTYGGASGNYSGLINKIKPYVVDQANIGDLASKEHSDVLIDGTVSTFRTYANGNINLYLLSSNYPNATVTGPGTPNPKSLCLMFENGTSKVILMGDAEENVEKQIIKNFADANAGFLNAYGLKLGHHGSVAGTSNAWIDAVKPKAIFASGDMVWAHPYCEPINRVIAKKVLAPTVQTLRYCCGTSKNDDYINTQKDLKVALNLWYIVYASKGENMKIDDTNQVVATPQGTTWGVQWELDFASAGATPSLTKTASANPV